MAGEGSGYHKLLHRISKKDLFICLALWMEESPLATSSQESDTVDLISSTVRNKRKYAELDDNQGPKRPKVVVVEKDVDSICSSTEEKCNRIFQKDCVSEQTVKSKSDCIKDIPKEDSVEVSDNTDMACNLNTVGVVVVDSNEHIVAIDYSHQGLHAVTNAMVVHTGKLRGCVVYASRKPCSSCTKFMIQMGITRVYYLPLQPECPTTDDLKHCEQMYKSCSISQSVYVPTICDNVVRDSSLKRSPYTPTKDDHVGLTQSLLNKYWTKEWIDILPKVLFWPDFKRISCKVTSQMSVMFEWLAKVTLVDVPECTRFKPYGIPNGLLAERIDAETHKNGVIVNDKISMKSLTGDLQWQNIALHMSRMAQLLAQRSDDPFRGVGAVVLKENEIVAVGWNGFPSKALYGNFPQANDEDQYIKEKKYPYITHAEQSAILFRLVQDINHSSTTMFVSKLPCNECIPIIIKVGVQNVVFPPERPKQYATFLKTDLIARYIDRGKLKGFVSEISPKNEAQMKVVSRNLLFQEMKEEKELLECKD